MRRQSNEFYVRTTGFAYIRHLILALLRGYNRDRDKKYSGKGGRRIQQGRKVRSNIFPYIVVQNLENSEALSLINSIDFKSKIIK